MKLTKYQHACLVIEKDTTTLVIDPGVYSHDFIMPKRVAGIIITHEHPDHFDENLVNKILSSHPKAVLIAHESISGRFSNYSTIAVTLGEPLTVGSFSLQFFGGSHANISPATPIPPNYGVLVDNRLYYPGDSFDIPTGVPVQELALPVSAPWLKISEAIHFLTQIKPAFAFPTHDAILSSEGKEVADYHIGTAASRQNTRYKRLDGLAIDL